MESWTSRRRPRNTNRRAYCRVLKGYGTLVRGRPPNRYGSSWSPAPAPSSEPIALPVFSCCREAIRFPVPSVPPVRAASIRSLLRPASAGTRLRVHHRGAWGCFGLPLGKTWPQDGAGVGRAASSSRFTRGCGRALDPLANPSSSAVSTRYPGGIRRYPGKGVFASRGSTMLYAPYPGVSGRVDVR